MDGNSIDEFTTERILDAAARGEVVDGFEHLGELLTAFHQPGSDAEMAAGLPAAAGTTPAHTAGIGRLTRRTAIAAAAGVFALSGVAAAVTGGAALFEPILGSGDPVVSNEATADDTLLNFGYDEGLHLFVWNTSATDGQYDCSLENGPVDATYATDDGSIVVDGLTGDIDGQQVDVSFPDQVDEAADPLPYSAESECALDAAEVAGPNGQVNHGMFMKLFNSLYEGLDEGTGRGCLNRFLAQSDLGKGDQQIRVSDVDPDFQPVSDGDTGEIDFSTVTADCEHGNGNSHAAEGDPIAANGNPHAANGNPHATDGEDSGDDTEPTSTETSKPDSPGRSADAPGHNR